MDGVSVAGAGRVNTSGDVISVLSAIDPLIHEDWEHRVKVALAKLSQQKRQFLYTHVLQKKGISFDPETRSFVFNGRKTVADLLDAGFSSAPLRSVASKIVKSRKQFEESRDTVAFADLVEAVISAIERIDSEDDVKLQTEKVALRQAFLDDLITLVKSTEFDVPKNRRSLTSEGIKSYMIEVYIRHQMQGYRFRTTPYSVLERDESPYVSGVIAKEARLRQCDVIKTDQYLFLIGPVKEIGQNPYSLRRFVAGEESMGARTVFFSGIAIPLDKVDQESAQEIINWLISRIVTLERQINKDVYAFMTGLEDVRAKYLSPILSANVSADGSRVDQVIDAKLKEFETRANLLFFGKILTGLVQVAKTVDEFEYLFFSIKNILMEIAFEIREFSGQSLTVFSQRADDLDVKIMSYTRLLEKKKDVLFSGSDKGAESSDEKQNLLVAEVSSILDEGMAKVESLEKRLQAAIKSLTEKKGTLKKFSEKIFGGGASSGNQPDELRAGIDSAKRMAVLKIIRAIKNYPSITVNLQFEDIVAVDESVRRYAIASGRWGLTQMPLLVNLYDGADNIDLPALKRLFLETVTEQVQQ